MNKIGVMLESFHTDIESAIKKSAEVGADGIQFYGAMGALDCDKLSFTEKKIFQQKLLDSHLEVSAICGELGGHGFSKKEDNKDRVAKTSRVMKWAKELNCSVVTTHIGVIPKEICEQRKNIADACKYLNEEAEKLNVYLAIETGSEKVQTLCDFLSEINCNRIAVNYDPANLVMVTGDDPILGVYILKDKIVHTHVKDGIMKKQTDPSTIYNYFAEGGIEDLRLSDYFEETTLLQGSVNIPEWLSSLNAIHYEGYLTLERETLGQDQAYEEIYKCITIIKSIQKNLS